MVGGLRGGGSKASDITDGLSKTIAVAEDVGRTEVMPGAYQDPLAGIAPGVPAGAIRVLALARAGQRLRGFPTQPQYRRVHRRLPHPGRQRPDQGHQQQHPFGGPPACPWYTAKSNCGPNDEIFRFHGPGANATFMDGHVTFLPDNINTVILRRLVSAAEGVNPLQNVPAIAGSAVPTDY